MILIYTKDFWENFGNFARLLQHAPTCSQNINGLLNFSIFTYGNTPSLAKSSWG
jgi:hypothetical protein